MTMVSIRADFVNSETFFVNSASLASTEMPVFYSAALCIQTVTVCPMSCLKAAPKVL